MKYNTLNLVPMTNQELVKVEGGGLVETGIAIFTATYAAGYAIGKAIYHAVN